MIEVSIPYTNDAAIDASTAMVFYSHGLADEGIEVELWQWLDDRGASDTKTTHIINRDNIDECHCIFLFPDDKADLALMFKLTWGGK